MARKSDSRRRRRVSATEASRTFSRLLDQVETGRRFVVHRHGRDVCVIAPPETQGRLASACLILLRSRTPVELDDRFAVDLEAVIEAETADGGPSWPR